MNSNEKHIFVVDFLTSGKNPGILLAQKKMEEALLIKEYIRMGPPDSLAITDPVLFARLRSAITQLMLDGW